MRLMINLGNSTPTLSNFVGVVIYPPSMDFAAHDSTNGAYFLGKRRTLIKLGIKSAWLFLSFD
jgi:hypothetical protein